MRYNGVVNCNFGVVNDYLSIEEKSGAEEGAVGTPRLSWVGFSRIQTAMCL